MASAPLHLPGYLAIAGWPDEGGRARSSFSPPQAFATWVRGQDQTARTQKDSSATLGWETFWKDAFDLVHKDDLPLLWFLVSMVMEEPGASESVEVRFRDAQGDWVLMDVCVLNVLEAPTSSDTGLVVVNVRHANGTTGSVGVHTGNR